MMVNRQNRTAQRRVPYRRVRAQRAPAVPHRSGYSGRETPDGVTKARWIDMPQASLWAVAAERPFQGDSPFIDFIC